jgi:hypothetical protein|tara:strand:+ start:425 stop:739 length:315 start_codon:yes stop_codon:yes gene_type:complete
MRKITKESVNAFFNKGKLNKQNMSVFFDRYDNTSRMLLHNNCIATYDYDNKRLTISNCGWFTPTTKERLNALPSVNIVQKNFKWYLNGNLKEWNGSKTEIKMPF